MPNLSANKKIRLASPGVVITGLSAVAGVLFVLHSNEQAFTPNMQYPDEISANYTELLLKKTPSNDGLRLDLIDLYLALARFDKAQHHLPLLHDVDQDVRHYYQFKVDAYSALGLHLDAQYASLRERLQSLEFAQLNSQQQEQVADLALQLDAASIAALIYENLAKTQPDQQMQYLDLAATWYFAGSQYEKAAQLHAVLAEKSTDQQRIDYQRLVVADYLASNDPASAVRYLQDIAEQPGAQLSREQLLEAIHTALLAADLQQALAFNRLLMSQEPDSVDARLTDLRLSIAVGDIQHAWGLRDWLLEHQPDDLATYIQLAQLGEWNHAFPEALELWIKALELQYEPARYEHAWRLSIQVFNFDRSVELLEAASDTVQLSDIELQALFYSHESRGTPEQAEQWLRSYIQRYPTHRLGWTYLLQSLENTEQHSQESAVWLLMSERFELKPKELVRWVETYLLNFDLAGAWQLLSQIDDSQITDADYWHLKAAVAWELEDDEKFLLVYQQMQLHDIQPNISETDQLIGLFTNTDPEKALALTLQRWKKTQQERDLMTAVYLAIDLQRWDILKELVELTADDAVIARSTPILLARVSLAERTQDDQLTEQVLRQSIELYPTDNQFRERLLLLYVDTNQRETLKSLLVQWRGLAQNDSRLWLAFAAANQLLNRGSEAIRWYQRYINLNPSDVLVRSAFADALESAEYFEAALLQRRALLDAPVLTKASETHYRTWLSLLAANYGQKQAHAQAVTWQDGSPSMLQLWFEQQLALLNQPEQDQQKTFWLTWAKQHNLVISHFEQVEEALRTFNFTQMQRLLVSQRMPLEQQVASLKAFNQRHRAGALALSQLSDEHAISSREQFRNQVLEELKTYPQGMQLGWQKRDFGGVTYTGEKLTLARALGDAWYARVDAEHGTLQITEAKRTDFSKEDYVSLALNRQLHNGSLDLSVNHSQSDLKSRTGAEIARHWHFTQKSNLSLGYKWKDRTDSSGLLYAVGQKDALWLRGYQQITARDSFSWGIEKNQYSTRDNDTISSGESFELQAAHTVFFANPTWLVKAGFDYQTNRLTDKILSKLPNNPTDNEPFNTGSLLVEKYKYAYVGTSLQRGMPGALNRTVAQYSWMIDAVVGHQWHDKKITYAVTAGVGAEIFGDDELALNVGYQSAPKSQLKSKPGGTLGVSYSLRFGR